MDIFDFWDQLNMYPDRNCRGFCNILTGILSMILPFFFSVECSSETLFVGSTDVAALCLVWCYKGNLSSFQQGKSIE